MPEDLTQKEKRQETAGDDALIKHVFDNLRNLFICISLMVAGGTVIKYRADLQFGSAINGGAGYLVLVLATGLMAWNIYHGYEKIIAPARHTKKIFLFMPFVMIYIFFVLTIGAALLRFHAVTQFRPKIDDVASNPALKRDTPTARSLAPLR